MMTNKRKFRFHQAASRPGLNLAYWLLKTGDEIAVPKEESLSSTVGVFPGVNPINDNTGTLNVKADTVFSDSESMGGRGQINQRLSERQGISAPDVQLNLFNDSSLQLDGKFFEFSFSAGSKFNPFDHSLNYDNPSSCLIFSKGTRPSFFASSMPFFSLDANLGLIGKWVSMASISHPTGLCSTYSSVGACSSNLASKAQSMSQREYVSNIKYFGEPFLSTTTPALKSFAIDPDFLSSPGIAANFSNASNLTACLIGNLTNDFDFMASPPMCVLGKAYHIIDNLSSRVYADVGARFIAPAYAFGINPLPREIVNISRGLGFHQGEWRKVCKLNVGNEIAVPKSDMFMFGPGDHLVMDKHCEYYQAEDTKDTQHNDHFSSPFSTTRIKNNIIRDANNVQNMSFCGNDNLAKNSPAKYPATMILAKSPTSFAIFSLDFGLSHFIYAIKHIMDIAACQADILERKAYADVGARFIAPAYALLMSSRRACSARTVKQELICI